MFVQYISNGIAETYGIERKGVDFDEQVVVADDWPGGLDDLKTVLRAVFGNGNSFHRHVEGGCTSVNAEEECHE